MRPIRPSISRAGRAALELLTKWRTPVGSRWPTEAEVSQDRLNLSGERACPEVVVEDVLDSMTAVWVPIDLPDDWIATHRGLLAAVLDAWDGHLSPE
ncbi:DUF5959 family protein [Streptomyces sp. NPDC059944]|uniref:DUF5959 family protein n=1 Tax=unclassified Streptomyces TaxID=2593676 RepID=UPI003659C06B